MEILSNAPHLQMETQEFWIVLVSATEFPPTPPKSLAPGSGPPFTEMMNNHCVNANKVRRTSFKYIANFTLVA